MVPCHVVQVAAVHLLIAWTARENVGPTVDQRSKVVRCHANFSKHTFICVSKHIRIFENRPTTLKNNLVGFKAFTQGLRIERLECMRLVKFHRSSARY